ncbi:MAG: hypothetical protein ACW98I_19055 [Candidatus Hodarchaeales archaeon]
MKRPVVVIPTYWTQGQVKQDDVIYDHPTNLQNPVETISKTLKSIERLDGEFDVLVVGCPVRASIGEKMDKAVKRIISDANLSYRTKYIGFREYEIFKRFTEDNLPEEFSNLISNRGYANVRNLCLLIPHILNYSIVILIDDDELITDVTFIDKAIEFIGSRIQNKILGLVVGYYQNADGSIFLDESNIPWWNLVWKKEKLMNEAFRVITDSKSERLVDTPFALGGNLIIHKKCWEQVPFDPLMTRGEDMDFLRNVKYFGFEAKLDRSLSIKHEPPPSPKLSSQKFRQDIVRFLYSKYKFEHMNLDLSEYDPYPGYFLHQTEGKVILTELLEFIYHNKDILIGLESVDQIIHQIQNIEFHFNNVRNECLKSSRDYFDFQKRWKELLLFLPQLPFPANLISEI